MLPKRYHSEILATLHEGVAGGHLGKDKTRHLVKSNLPVRLLEWHSSLVSNLCQLCNLKASYTVLLGTTTASHSTHLLKKLELLCEYVTILTKCSLARPASTVFWHWRSGKISNSYTHTAVRSLCSNFTIKQSAIININPKKFIPNPGISRRNK